MSSPLYELSDVRFAYPGRTAPALVVDHLELAPGRVHLLVGPNGAGKTTLLHLLGLLRRPGVGRIVIDGLDPWANGRRTTALTLRRGIALVSHDAYLFRGSVAANLAYGLKVRGVPRRRREGEIARALELVALPEFNRRRVDTLSAGEAQRVALARALVCQPRVLLLDEAGANLDRASQAVFERIIKEVSDQGLTVVLATHQADLAARFPDNTIQLAEGRLRGRPARPAIQPRS
ncbi:MAG: energy-coupling factor ABC transporter ATP-binding protein [Proteobacteria bacterium]|nr:energy-coupling factor ABC transporter ATP-binding protein [Pseudomonadota bacterium]MBU1742124.1 energy-coupling factor ABC transporter ATP-binding protein [Pseudomonadota bacterium]